MPLKTIAYWIGYWTIFVLVLVPVAILLLFYWLFAPKKEEPFRLRIFRE